MEISSNFSGNHLTVRRDNDDGRIHLKTVAVLFLGLASGGQRDRHSKGIFGKFFSFFGIHMFFYNCVGRGITKLAEIIENDRSMKLVRKENWIDVRFSTLGMSLIEQIGARIRMLTECNGDLSYAPLIGLSRFGNFRADRFEVFFRAYEDMTTRAVGLANARRCFRLSAALGRRRSLRLRTRLR